MKKIGILAVMMMLMTIVSVAQAQRAGGMPELTIDPRIGECGNCVVTIDLNVEFDTNKAVIKDKYYNEIKKVSDFMKKYPDTTAVIEGHTDNVDSDEYNQKLSQARANSVRQYLINKFGIKASRLSAIGYGESRPIASNGNEEGRQKNRRVQAVIKAITKK